MSDNPTLGKDFKVCNSTKLLAEFESLTLSVRSPTIVEPPNPGEVIPVFNEGPLEITWLLETGNTPTDLDLDTLTDFCIAFDSNPPPSEFLLPPKGHEDNNKARIDGSGSGMGSYEISGCNFTSTNESDWKGTATSIVYTPKSIADKELEKLC